VPPPPSTVPVGTIFSLKLQTIINSKQYKKKPSQTQPNFAPFFESRIDATKIASGGKINRSNMISLKTTAI
jgi:hypothetical protein